VHDYKGAAQFMIDCFTSAKSHLKNTALESRIDSSFFNQDILSMLGNQSIRLTASVPFERFVQLKSIVKKRHRLHKINEQWSFFEANWKPKSWDTSFRLIFT
jgi:hypothetical protein